MNLLRQKLESLCQICDINNKIIKLLKFSDGKEDK